MRFSLRRLPKMEANTPTDSKLMQGRPRSRWRLTPKILVWAFGIIFLLGLLPGEAWVVQIPYFLICGWFHYLAKVLPQVHINLGMIFSGVVSFGLAVITSHMFFRWFWRQRNKDQPWRWSSTICLCLLIPLLFGLSIAVGGIAHQGAWLMHEPRWVVNKNSGRWTRNISNAKQLIIYLRIWSSDNGGSYPERLEQLFTDGIADNNRVFNYVSSDGGTPELLVYLPGLVDSDPGDLPIVIGPHSETGNRWVMGLNDGSVSMVSGEDFAKAMSKWKQRTAAPKDKSR